MICRLMFDPLGRQNVWAMMPPPPRAGGGHCIFHPNPAPVAEPSPLTGPVATVGIGDEPTGEAALLVPAKAKPGPYLVALLGADQAVLASARIKVAVTGCVPSPIRRACVSTCQCVRAAVAGGGGAVLEQSSFAVESMMLNCQQI